MEEKFIQTRFMRFPNGLKKAVTFSYDDGCLTDIRLAEKLNSCGMKCTFNISTAFVEEEKNGKRISYSELKEHFLDKGHEVAVHGKHHRAPGTTTAIEGIAEVLECRKELETKLDTIIRGMAYPNSGITFMNPDISYPQIKNYLTELGIAYARSLRDDNNLFKLPNDWHNWIPTAHHDNPNIMEWINQFVNFDFEKTYHASRHSKLFYIWGHTFEFEGKKNWHHLDEICEALGGREDIWYATNIEIYDYVKAYEALIWRSDFMQVHNPTTTTVWFEVNQNMYCINSGETIKIDKL